MAKSQTARGDAQLIFREYRLSDDFPVLVLTPDAAAAVYHEAIPSYHFHNCIEIGFCYKHRHLLCFDSRVYELKPGDFFVLSPYSMHYVRHTEKICGCCEYLYVKPEGLLRDFYPLDIPETMYWYKNSDVPFIFSASTHPDIYQLLMLILEEYRARKSGFQYIVKGLFLTLMSELTRQLSARSYSDFNKYRNISSLLPALKTIHTSYNQPLKSANLARECHLSPSGFHTLFLEQLGETPGRYLIRIRLQKACELLYGTELSVLDIAIESGFSSLSNFYRCFRNLYHTSPQKWREQYRSIQKRDVKHSPLISFSQQDSYAFPPPKKGQ